MNKGERILVVGGSGFIGSDVSEHLVNSGYYVTCLTRKPDSPNIANLRSKNNFQVVYGDVLNPDSLNTAVKGNDGVIYAAGITSVDQSINDPNGTISANVQGLLNTLAAIRLHGSIPIEVMSTDHAYGSHREGVNERMFLNPHTPYAASKTMQTMLLGAYFHSFGIKYKIAELSNIFGPGQGEDKFIPKVTLSAQAEQKATLYWDGSQQREWMYVKDASRAIITIFFDGQAGQRYLVGPGTVRTNKDIALAILNKFGKGESDIQYVINPRKDDEKHTIESDKLKQKLGWEPQYTFGDALTITTAWYRENAKNFPEPRPPDSSKLLKQAVVFEKKPQPSLSNAKI